MERSAGTLGSYAAYPVVVGGGVALHLALAAAGVPVVLAANAPVALGMLAVTWLERRLPYRREWRGGWSDVKSDLAYLVVVQALLPRVLGFLAALTLVRWIDARAWAVAELWPGHLPLGVQVVLVVLGADLLRYGLHVLSHHHPLLWRLHAVHHSPEKLYWLNVGRFHPFEKAIQFTADALPFIVLGVGEPVLAIYFVFFAINGFFQHSNCSVRLGPLNYIVSGPELHRWHHSRLAAESDTNFGNNLIIWDLLFGTRFLPADREVGPLGLRNEAYPLNFMAQLTSPFVADPGAD